MVKSWRVVGAGVWAVAISVTAQWLAWQAGQDTVKTAGEQPGGGTAVAYGALGAVLAAMPSVLLAVRGRDAVARVWVWAAAGGLLLGTARFVPIPEHELYLSVLAVLAALGVLIARNRRPAEHRTVPAGIVAGVGLLLPWLWVGALGGPVETALAVIAAGAVGWLAAAVLAPAYPGNGLVLGVGLVLIAAGVGQPGSNLAVLALAPAGFAVARMRGRVAVGVLAGFGVLGPLAFVGPEEVTVMLTGRDVPIWTAIAGVGTAAIAVTAGVLFRFMIPGRGYAAALLLVGMVVYVGAGQPGFHGDRLFVILADQANLSDIDTSRIGPSGRDARASEVHDRLVRQAERTQAGLRHDLDRLGIDYTRYYLINALEVDAGPWLRPWLERRADVGRVLLSPHLRPLPLPVDTDGGPADPVPGDGWNITAIGADRVWSEMGVRGAGVVIGASDSGVDGTHPALSANFRGGGDSWLDPWNGTRAPVDHSGHGTHTLGSAVGGGIGVAPDAQWVGCVNMDRNLSSPARYLDCLQFMMAPFPVGGDPVADGRPGRGPQVLTNSWNCPAVEGCDLATFVPATAAFAVAGTFVVASAGNGGPGCATVDLPPGPYPDVVTVGATDHVGAVAAFSSRGPGAKPDLVAPGARIRSALPGGGYGEMSGTSMAAPQVAGVVALMWSAAPALIGDLPRTRALLNSTATPVTGPATDCGAAGAGLVNAPAAVRAALGLGPEVPPG
ncbi:S8 family serine peptidase [Micromonospora sp. HUAS LYJ1]|uniref:S8 family serine peptidase n=1 Tax=Micromonospora sp. HUAS LYJ1 TaxID=3061626 RepID=UPI002672B23D|nr:S8 family serine peptidase [Micromonospora sp. HUAS LYJ1]WKU04000.1 S8 family serine peptidase [Micromonospora sp. HUAS LYJ1]